MFGNIRFITFEDYDDIPIEKILEALSTIGISFEVRECTDYVDHLENLVEEFLDLANRTKEKIFESGAMCRPSSWDRFK